MKRRPIELLDELVLEILVRLPVKSLLRFRSVSKAWRATISDPFFIRAQLDHSASKLKRNPSFLITPHALTSTIEGEEWPTTFSTRLRFYQWQPGSSSTATETATLVHGQDFPGEFSSVCQFAHCDGLVLLPTNTNVYLFNPATRDTLTLPQTNPNKIPVPPYICLPAGLGRDPRTGRYKVARAFYRSIDPATDVFHMGMQVYTVGDPDAAAASWRDTAADPPYTVVEWTTARSVEGSIFWVVDMNYEKLRPPRCLLRFDLEDETFGLTGLPDSVDPGLHESVLLDVMNGKLCLIASCRDAMAGQQPPDLCIIWTLERDAGDDAVMLYARHRLYRYRPHTAELTEMCDMDGLKYHRRRAGTFESAGRNVFFFNVIPYIESLVRVTV
uniref:Uncharacterized protein n=1 Tax=Avena sativa TaxID=4498 RepID=A0ACD5WEK1_AVESA